MLRTIEDLKHGHQELKRDQQDLKRDFTEQQRTVAAGSEQAQAYALKPTPGATAATIETLLLQTQSQSQLIVELSMFASMQTVRLEEQAAKMQSVEERLKQLERSKQRCAIL
jgi:hypothetical protein